MALHFYPQQVGIGASDRLWIKVDSFSSAGVVPAAHCMRTRAFACQVSHCHTTEQQHLSSDRDASNAARRKPLHAYLSAEQRRAQDNIGIGMARPGFGNWTAEGHWTTARP